MLFRLRFALASGGDARRLRVRMKVAETVLGTAVLGMCMWLAAVAGSLF